MEKLGGKHKHIMELIDRDKDSDGWAKVSEQLYPVLSSLLPSELATFEKLDDGGRARLTEEGQSVLNATKWL